jgi:hypothetical protein
MSTKIQSILQFIPPETVRTPEKETTVLSCEDNTQTIDNPPYHFGVLEISTPEKDAIPYTWDVKFDIDRSGSMSDSCMDGRTKMQHIKLVLSNILRLFASYENMTFNVSVHSFNHNLYVVFDFAHITKDNVNMYIEKLNAIHPDGQTNLLLPVQKTMQQMSDRERNFPTNKRLHFLLTDGVDTCNNSPKTIINAFAPQYDTIVFGFGRDHDSKTLMAIGEKPFCEYAFIAEIEKAGIVYGEYIHNVLYRCIEDIRISVTNAEIYCWKTNTWENTLSIGNLASGLTKSYYVRTMQSPYDVCGEIHGRILVGTGEDLSSQVNESIVDILTTEYTKLDVFETMPHLIDENGNLDVSKINDHSFRIKTLELMYEVAHIDDDEETSNYDNKWAKLAKPPSYHQKKDKLRQKLNDLYKTISAYKKTVYGDIENTFLVSLMDDLYIAHRSFDMRYGRLYAASRQRTQGSQNVYTPTIHENNTNINNNDLFTSKPFGHTRNNITRTTSDMDVDMSHIPQGIPVCNGRFFGKDILSYEENTAPDNNITGHTLSYFDNTDYSSQKMMSVIRSTSDNSADDV